MPIDQSTPGLPSGTPGKVQPALPIGFNKLDNSRDVRQAESGSLINSSGEPLGGVGGVAISSSLTSPATDVAASSAAVKALKDLLDTHFAGADPHQVYTTAAELAAALTPSAPVYSTAWKVSNLSTDWLPSQSPSANVTLTNDDNGAIAGGSTACLFTPTAAITITTPSGSTSVPAGVTAMVIRLKPRADEPARWVVAGGSSAAAITVPSAPVGLAAGSILTTSLTLAFSAPATDGGAPVTDYGAAYSIGGETWIDITDPVSTSLSIAVTGLSAATSYLFRARALNSVGWGPWTTPIAATTASAGATAPGTAAVSNPTAITPTGLTYTYADPASNGGSPITSRQADISFDGGTTWTALPAPAVGANTISYTGNASARTAQIRARAINAVGNGAYGTLTGIAVPALPASLIGTALRSLAYTDVVGALTESGDFTAGYVYTKTATGTYGTAYDFRKNGGAVLGAAERLVSKVVQGGTAADWTVPVPGGGSIDFSAGGGAVTLSNGTAPTTLDALPTTAAEGAWSRGADWASRATITAGIWSQKIVSGTVRLYGTTNNGSTWLEIAVFTKATATAWGQYSAFGLYGTGQTLTVSFTAS